MERCALTWARHNDTTVNPLNYDRVRAVRPWANVTGDNGTGVNIVAVKGAGANCARASGARANGEEASRYGASVSGADGAMAVMGGHQ